MAYSLPIPQEVLDSIQNVDCHGYLHSVETGAAVDGPGMRFVFFMAGCQFRCLYCHNPDTWKLHNGRPVELEDMLSEVGKYANFLRFAGGVTFSGGEPMMQAPFVGAAAKAIKDAWGLHIALDTQGFLHGNVEDDWFDPIDLVMLDIKHINPERYLELTSQPLQPTLDFAQRLLRLGKQMRIRYVLVPGWSDAPEEVKGMADLVQSYGDAVEMVEVLPFHQMGTSKWDQLGLEYKLRDTPTPTRDEAEAARDIFRSRGLVAS
ncbi:pyruvate formate lyase activating enzyme [Aliiruegeria haliotis]|uniref:Pyruvate formate-lyase-activating enzyme n=1 Tax=Aliiruegeria haliotis TaxID=1280846 RepID=A0A2T0RIL2_9RHOB|nr:pyruvate formate-lyase-activating protein [Aliiruegeria haliotis]PRY20940.1 pyruvate formate lyase activating enzyme [Aliiruegeria haliotis]